MELSSLAIGVKNQISGGGYKKKKAYSVQRTGLRRKKADGDGEEATNCFRDLSSVKRNQLSPYNQKDSFYCGGPLQLLYQEVPAGLT